MLKQIADATPVRKIPLNKVPFVPNNKPLLGILDKFQEGRSHMAIVSRFSVERATSVKQAVKRGLTQRLRDRVGMGDSDSSSDCSSDEEGRSSQRKRPQRQRPKKPKRRRRFSRFRQSGEKPSPRGGFRRTRAGLDRTGGDQLSHCEQPESPTEGMPLPCCGYQVPHCEVTGPF